MLNPFLLMTVFYLVVAVVIALDAVLTSFNLIPWFVGLPWLRVHFITLGVLVQAAFGALPDLAATRRGAPAPATRWDIWLLLNAGLVLLLAGVPSINPTLIIAGGVLTFAAASLLMLQLRAMGGPAPGSGSQKFYLAALAYLLVGIVVGTGLWVGWSEPLRIAAPKETHIHANVWGFAGLLFAGLWVDLLPALTGRNLAGRRAIQAIFGALTVGALLLLLAPWLGAGRAVIAPGMALLLLGTAALIGAAARQLGRAGLFQQAGAWHLILAYGWILLPAAAMPLLLLSAAPPAHGRGRSHRAADADLRLDHAVSLRGGSLRRRALAAARSAGPAGRQLAQPGRGQSGCGVDLGQHPADRRARPAARRGLHPVGRSAGRGRLAERRHRAGLRCAGMKPDNLLVG
jgi:hypothetical protein